MKFKYSVKHESFLLSRLHSTQNACVRKIALSAENSTALLALSTENTITLLLLSTEDSIALIVLSIEDSTALLALSILKIALLW